MLFRPPEYLEDVRERELEIARWRSGSAADLHCPVCRAAVEPDFLVCPVCTTKLKQACVSCKAPLEPLWQVCPYCETPIARRRRSSSTLDLDDRRAGAAARRALREHAAAPSRGSRLRAAWRSSAPSS